MTHRLKYAALAISLVLPTSQTTLAETFAPYGTAKVDMHSMPVTDIVFDVNYADPNQLSTLYKEHPQNHPGQGDGGHARP